MSIWKKFTAWLSGWPESMTGNTRAEKEMLFEEDKLKTKQEEKTKVGRKKNAKGLKPKKKKESKG